MNLCDYIAVHTDTGRRAAYFLHEIGFRAVIAGEGLRFVRESVSPSGSRNSCGAWRVPQPRDERGRFVPYWLLAFDIETELSYIDWANGLWWEQPSGMS